MVQIPHLPQKTKNIIIYIYIYIYEFIYIYIDTQIYPCITVYNKKKTLRKRGTRRRANYRLTALSPPHRSWHYITCCILFYLLKPQIIYDYAIAGDVTVISIRFRFVCNWSLVIYHDLSSLNQALLHVYNVFVCFQMCVPLMQKFNLIW